jgi:predicted branched-subunit amino acid permease
VNGQGRADTDGVEAGDDGAPLSRWWLRGMARFVSVPAIVLMGAFIGFGALARESGLSIAQATVMSGLIWALPSKVVLIGAIVGGASLVTAAFAVALSAVRLMPMVMALTPVIRNPRSPWWALVFMSHFVAITAWVFGMTEVARLPRRVRMAYFLGFATTIQVGAMGVTALSYLLSGALPLLLAAGLVFLTPLYFVLSLWGAARDISDRLALGSGIAAFPVFHWLAPQFDLLLTGLVCGTFAWGVGLARRRREIGR